MPRRRRRGGGLQKLGADALGLVASAREAGKAALQELRREIGATRRFLEKLIAEERIFRSELFRGRGPGRPPTAGRPRKVAQPAGRKTAARRPGRARGLRRRTSSSASYQRPSPSTMCASSRGRQHRSASLSGAGRRRSRRRRAGTRRSRYRPERVTAIGYYTRSGDRRCPTPGSPT